MVILSEVLETSSSGHHHHQKYDVFLSFRGDDTRYNFTNHLHKALEGANLKTFLDNEEIQTGLYLKPELETAIKTSRASVIVLSRNYASSTWCLEELVLILEQHRTCGHIVIPIFYHVEPTDVRKQQKSFKVAMDEHKKKMEAEIDVEKRSMLANKIDKWKEALTQVADLKGLDAKDRLETEFMKEIVDDIYGRLGGTISSSLPLLIGMDYSIDFITSWLKDVSSHTVDILTISGMSGIGKTSVANHVYELHRREFDASSFIEGISSSCAQFNGMLGLQKQLLGHILKTSPVEVHRVSEYTSIIENALSRIKVFLVLDDIDSVDQLNELLGNKGLHPGSKIIITAKNASFAEGSTLFNLQVKPKHTEHRLEGLYDDESRKLLFHHAFNCEELKDGYKEVSDNVVKYCEGHPLALKVMGRSLYNKDVAYWDECINKLNQGPFSRINNILKMSFESLESEDKELIKHVACFFVGMDRDIAETILKACKIKHTRYGISNLSDRCLLNIGWGNKFMMHSLIQEMVKDAVHQESPYKPEKRSRLWRHTESYKVFKKKTGTRNIKGLALDMNMIQKESVRGSLFELGTDAFSEMDDLKLLQLNYVQLNGSYKDFPKKLIWLCMHWFPLESMPSDLPMKKLVALDMSYSNITSFDMFSSNPQRPEKRQKLTGSSSKDTQLLGSLKILDVSFCKKLCSLGGFFELPALERLMARNCKGLVEICESIEQCRELAFIDLSYSNKLEKLLLGKLEKVETLLLDACFGESQIEMRGMGSLEMLNLNNISINSQTSSFSIVMPIPQNLKFLPVSFPSSLVRLSLERNNLYNESFPTDLSSLSMLKELILDDNPIVSMPNFVRTLPRLETLAMNLCKMLTSIEHPPPTLTCLSAYSIYGLIFKVVFDSEMSPMGLLIHVDSFQPSPIEIEGALKVQAMADVEERVLRSLGWSNLDFTKKGRILTSYMEPMQMYYEFGIFSTIYIGQEMPNWISGIRKDGPSISFTIPSSPKNLTGLNIGLKICYAMFNTKRFIRLPVVKISNITKNCCWIYNNFKLLDVKVNGEYLIYISHWMFTMNDMEPSDHVTITAVDISECEEELFLFEKKKKKKEELIIECGVSFVYDDGNIKEEEDALGYYKSWNHIIGGDLSHFQLTTGEYLLDHRRFSEGSHEIPYYLSPETLPVIAIDAKYIAKRVLFKAFSHKKSNIHDRAIEDKLSR